MNTTPSPGALTLKKCLYIAPVILCFIGIFVLFTGISKLYAVPTSELQGSTTKGSSPSQPAADVAVLKEQVRILSNQVEELSKSREVLKDRLDSVSQQASHVQWLLSIVLAVAGFFTLAQGVFAFFSAQNYVKQAEDAIKRANDGVKVMDSLAADVRARFPMFTNIEEARAEAFKELSKLSSVLERDYENLYASSEWLTRQKILAIESFSAMQFLVATDRNRELTRNLQLLGKFYGGKFKTDATALATDFERARYYLHLALQKSDRNYSVLNDNGWLFSLVAKPPRLEIAKQLFEESLQSKPDQQRALYNLGTLCWEKGNPDGLKKGLKYLEAAKEQPNWEETPNPAMAACVDYNLACFNAALAEVESDPKAKAQLLDKCCRHLELAAPVGTPPKELLMGDLASGGDLANFAASESHRERLQRIIATYETAW